MIAKTPGSFEINAALSRVSMAEPYIADDFNLSREVSLNFFPDIFTDYAER